MKVAMDRVGGVLGGVIWNEPMEDGRVWRVCNKAGRVGREVERRYIEWEDCVAGN